MKLPIYTPKPVVDSKRARLIQLLSQLLLEQLSQDNPNRPRKDVVLSEAERSELQTLIDDIRTDRSFFASLAFIDGLTGSNRMTSEQLRELYLSERRRRGFSRRFAASQWHQFLTRLGARAGDLSTLVRATRRMPLEHFEEMESRLLSYFKIPNEVRANLLRCISESREQLERIRADLSNFPYYFQFYNLKAETRKILNLLQEKRDSLSSKQVAGMTIVVVDTTALFTTRDWSVSGTLSTIAGALTMTLKE